MALDFAGLLAGGASTKNCIPGELPHITIGLQTPSPAKGVPKGGDCGVELLKILEVNGGLQELVGFGDESGTVRGIAYSEGGVKAANQPAISCLVDEPSWPTAPPAAVCDCPPSGC